MGTSQLTKLRGAGKRYKVHKDGLLLTLFAVIAALACVFTTFAAAVVVMLLCLLFGAHKGAAKNLAALPLLPTVGLIGLTVLYSISALRSPFGADAVMEVCKNLCALSLAVFAVLRFRKEQALALLWCYTAVVTTAAFLSLDMAGGRVLFAPIARLGNTMGMSFGSFDAMSSLRLNGIFNNCNVLAGMTGLSFLVGLHLLRTAEGRTGRTAAAVLVGINGVTFWLCVSRGAILCLAVSLVVWLMLTEGQERLGLFLEMLICAGATAVFAAASLPMLGPEGGSILADGLVILCGLVLLALDRWVTGPLHRLLRRRPKLLPLCGGALAVLMFCAVTLTGSYTFDSSHFIFRTADLQAGETYTVTGDWDGDMMFYVVTEGADDLLLDRQTLIYEGPLEEAVFVLPADTASVLLRFDGSRGDVLRQVEFTGGEQVKLNRLLLPESLESRLADRLITSTGFLLRLEYMKDGLKIWKTAPLMGRGLGSTANLYPLVQRAPYESLYAHNHAVQLLADLGLLGFAVFSGVIIGLSAHLCRRKPRKDPEKALFLSCLTMLVLHSLMEINFSVRAYAVQGYLLLAVMAVACGEGKMPQTQSRKRAASVLVSGFLATLALMSGLLLSHRILHRAAGNFCTDDRAELLSVLEMCILLDAFADRGFMELYVEEATDAPRYQAKADRYAATLERQEKQRGWNLPSA